MPSNSRHLFKQVSLLSTSDVRYDGRLYIIDNEAGTIALQHVKCMGTEGRKSGDQAIAPSECTYEFIIFRAENIQMLHLAEPNDNRDLTQEILQPLISGGRRSVRMRDGGGDSRGVTGGGNAERTEYLDAMNGAHGDPTIDMVDDHNPPLPRDDRRDGYEHYDVIDPAMAQQANRGSQRSPVQQPMHSMAHPSAPKRKVGVDRNAYAAPQPTYSDRARVRQPRYQQQAPRGAEYGEYSQQSYYQAPPPRYPPQQQQRYRYPSQPVARRPAPYRASYYLPPEVQQSHYYRSAPRRAPQQYYYDQPYQRRQQPYASRGAYPQQRPPARQGGSGYYQQRPYRRNDQQQRSQPHRSTPGQRGGPTSNALVGTGEFLGDRRLRGDEIENPKTDFDFEAGNAQLEKLQEAKTEDPAAEALVENAGVSATQVSDELIGSGENKLESNAVEAADSVEQSEQLQNEDSPTKTAAEPTDESTKGPVYNKSSSFFDDLTVETRAMRRRDATKAVRELRDVDAQTFGTVAQTYKSRHVTNRPRRTDNNRPPQQRFNRRDNKDYRAAPPQRQQHYHQQQQLTWKPK